MSSIRGLSEFRKKLDDLGQRVNNLDGQRSVPIPELLTPEFLANCSRFNSAYEMFEASGFKIDSPEDFKAIPDSEWGSFIGFNTSYDSWHAMLGEAVKKWTIKQLGF